MAEMQRLGERFERLVFELLTARDFSRAVTETVGPDKRGVDLLATRGNDLWAIEIKYYRTRRAQVGLIESAASALALAAQALNAARAMLVISSSLDDNVQLDLGERFSIQIVDRETLQEWAASFPQILDQLNGFLDVEEVAGLRIRKAEPPEPRTSPRVAKPADTQGSMLCARLKQLGKGKTLWREYERLCEDCLKYLFSDDLIGWHQQQRTDDGLNRFDLICRIVPNREFWKFLMTHLNSRYILFEFKNYSRQVSQGQILTTEKYLLEKGLRRVGIVFSRLGGDASARKTSQGSMREFGKLILVIKDADVCEMLHMRERGDDPTDYLFEVADEFLLSLPR